MSTCEIALPTRISALAGSTAQPTASRAPQDDDRQQTSDAHLDRLLAGSNGKCEDEVEHLASGTARNSFIGRPPPSLVVNHR